jgi:hypothetical protein
LPIAALLLDGIQRAEAALFDAATPGEPGDDFDPMQG